MKDSARLFLSFFTIFLSVYGVAHLYIWWRLVKPWEPEGAAAWVLRVLLGSLFVSFPVVHIFFRHQNGVLLGAVHYLAAVWMGMVLYFVLVTLAGDLLRMVLFRVAFDGRAMAATTAVIVAAITLYGLIEARCVSVTELHVRMADLPREQEGMRIVQITDVHMGRIVHGPRIEEIVTQVNRLHPDLVVITGDLVDSEALHMEDMVEPLRRLKARHGVYAVTGNHEFFTGIGPAQAFYQQAGVTLLRNRWVALDGGLQLLGLDDPVAFRMTGERPPSLGEIMRGMDRAKPTLLLLHTPVTTLEQLKPLGIQLQLSGHTHHGQLWPFNYIVKHIYRKTPYGLFTDGETTIYVSRGTGTWGPPMRVAAPPEITLITLSAKN